MGRGKKNARRVFLTSQCRQTKFVWWFWITFVFSNPQSLDTDILISDASSSRGSSGSQLKRKFKESPPKNYALPIVDSFVLFLGSRLREYTSEIASKMVDALNKCLLKLIADNEFKEAREKELNVNKVKLWLNTIQRGQDWCFRIISEWNSDANNAATKFANASPRSQGSRYASRRNASRGIASLRTPIRRTAKLFW